MPPDKATSDVVAAFDFDGTLTSRDSFMLFLSAQRPRGQLLVDLAVTLPLLLLYALRLTGNDTHKMALFARQFSGMPVEQYREEARKFSLEKIPGILRPSAVERLAYHQARGHRIVIITASFSDWIRPWAATQGIGEVIGSEAEVVQGRLTGRLDGANCYGPEKVRRLLALHPDRQSYTLFAYGDSQGDRELLAAADQGYHRRFS